MAQTAKPTTIEEYIAAAPEIARPNLRAIHECLTGVAPHADQAIKWGAPCYTGRRIYFSFAGFKTHTNFYPTPQTIKVFADRLKDYRTTDVGVSFAHAQPLPLQLIAEIATHRMHDVDENDARWM